MAQLYCHSCGEERRVTSESMRSQYPHFCHLCRKQAERGTLKVVSLPTTKYVNLREVLNKAFPPSPLVKCIPLEEILKKYGRL